MDTKKYGLNLMIKVAGVTFEGRQEKIARLNGDEPVRIVPEPDNKYDPHALAVHVASGGEVLHVGYVPRELASQIAPVLDGESLDVVIHKITGGFDLKNGEIANYGMVIHVRVYGENWDSADQSVYPF